MTNNSSENADGKDVKRKSVAREYAEAIFIALLLALFIRTFVVQAFKIPSGSKGIPSPIYIRSEPINTRSNFKAALPSRL